TGARLRRVADAARRTAHRARWLEGVRRAVVADPVAVLRVVAHTGRRTAHRRALRVRRTGRAAARAVLRRVADAGRRAAEGARRLEAVGRASIVDAVAA